MAAPRSLPQRQNSQLRGAPARGVAGLWRPAMKSVPSLQLPHKALVDVLTSGHSYDNESTAVLVNEGNRLFASRQLQKAAEAYGAAFEIARLHYVYPPLMHDLVVYRVLCLSMLGDLKRALFEVELALQILPGAPTTYLVQGIIYFKMQRTEDANDSFHRAVEQCALLQDLVDSIVALFAQASGHCDHAIEICSEVLQRSPRFPAALFARCTAYKFHASGYFQTQSDDDCAALLDEDPNVAPFMEERFTVENHAQMEELLLHFHPWFAQQAPRPYEDYPMYSQRQPFLTVALVCFAIAKLKTLVRSSRLIRSVREKHQELLQQRAAAERRMLELVEAQRNFTHLEQHTEVWGPADPDHQFVRKYRRYWMERPADFPKRNTINAPSSQPLMVDRTAAVCGSVEAPALSSTAPTSRAPAVRALSSTAPALSSSAPVLVGATALGAGTWAGTASAHGGYVPEAKIDNYAAMNNSQLRKLARSLGASDDDFELADQCGNADDLKLELMEIVARLKQAQEVPAQRSAWGAPEEEPSLVRATASTAPPPLWPPPPPLPRPGDASASVVSIEDAENTSRSIDRPLLRRSTTASLPASGLQCSSDHARITDAPPPRKIGADWTEQQWFLKALELAGDFSNGSSMIDLNMNPSCKPPDLPDHQPIRKFAPLPVCSLIRTVDGKDENIIGAIEREGFDVIPDWYGALDRIYAITDMACISGSPEAFVGDAQRAGQPGLSYLIPKSSGQNNSVFTPADEEARARAQEALLVRYQNRLVVTSLP